MFRPLWNLLLEMAVLIATIIAAMFLDNEWDWDLWNGRP